MPPISMKAQGDSRSEDQLCCELAVVSQRIVEETLPLSDYHEGIIFSEKKQGCVYGGRHMAVRHN